MIWTRKAAEISVWSSVKIDKYEYFTGKDILPSNQHQIIEQPKFSYSPLGKTFENNWRSRRKTSSGFKRFKRLKFRRPSKTTS